MASRIKIEFTDQPTAFQSVTLNIAVTSLAYSKTIYKVFIPSGASTSSNVPLGVDFAGTAANFYNNLIAFNTDSLMSFEQVETSVYINFDTDETVDLEFIATFSGVEADVEEYEPAPVEQLDPLNIDDICIEIFDTYENDRLLIEELTQVGSPKISWDSGDDLLQALMSSQLTFNMWVDDAADGKFFHLFTGDEKRYRVELSSIDPEENKELIWRGFLLPDFYEEPYKNGGFFVNFTATDMLGSLKGKTLKPWFYNNSFPIAKLLSYCLAETGLNQPMIVAPSIIPNSGILRWKDINVPLSQYVASGKYADLYSIMIDVLEANELTLYNFRGRWFLVGVTRKKDETLSGCYAFTADGMPDGRIDVVKKVSSPLKLEGTPIITALTPWKRVTVDYDIKGTKNLFTDDVVNKPWFGSNYAYNQFWFGNGLGSTPTDDYYRTAYFGYWIKVGAPLLDLNRFNHNNFDYRAFNSPDYECTEAAALANYFECTQQVYLKAGTFYELELEMEALLSVDDTSEFVEKLAAGALDRLFPFQIIHNGDEVLSNRPSAPSSENIRYETSRSQNFNFSKTTFKLKYEFKTEFSGKVQFRMLSPIVSSFSNMGLNSFLSMTGKVLKINVLDDYNYTESTQASRQINFTNELERKVRFGCSEDISIQNSFGLAYPLTDQYFWDISRTDVSIYEDTHFFSPATVLGLMFVTWSTDQNTFDLLFKYDLKKNVFVQLPDNTQRELRSLYANQMGAAYRMGFLWLYEGNPVIPKDYKMEPGLAEDDLVKYMRVVYPIENIAARSSWIIWGADSETGDTFSRTLAAALHYIRPETSYSLESTFLQLILPNELIDFPYYDQNRIFIPTRLELDLTIGKTVAKTIEAKYVDDLEIIYE